MTVRDSLRNKNIPALILQSVLMLGAATFFTLMLVYSYQGWFTRYMADDYCNAVLFSENFTDGLYQRYMTGFGGNRYSNIWLVGISEFFGIKSIPVLPVFHIMLWVIGLILMMSGVKKLVKAEWSFAMTSFLGLSIAFFTLIQAPNLYQTVYWRSSMSTHFAPVVYGTLLLAFLLNQSYKAATQSISISSIVIAFISAFIVGGFSEPADAVQVTILILAIAAVWRWGSNPSKKRILTLLGWTLGAAILSLTVMVISPANSQRLGDDPPGLMLLIHDAFYFSYIFITKTLRELPLPNALSIFVPAFLMWIYGQINNLEVSAAQKRNLWFVVIAIPLIAYLLIVASFSPSVYGQGYPVPRVQFYARLIMTIGLLADGALIGILLSQAQPKIKHPVLRSAIVILFSLVAVIYPFRAVMRAWSEIPTYRARAEDWDKRDAIIRALAAQGETDLTVIQFDGVDGTKELDTFATHWVNRCAANYYEVKSIRAIPIPSEYIDEYFNEQSDE
ncbi:MAG: hypothetical protein IPN96_16765 [Anaerolineales bacterium]|nr:hypothetical protein [Anaerolineales bacterium]